MYYQIKRVEGASKPCGAGRVVKALEGRGFIDDQNVAMIWVQNNDGEQFYIPLHNLARLPIRECDQIDESIQAQADTMLAARSDCY